MKRLYVVLGLLLILCLWTLSSFGQKREDPLEKRLQLREEMHRRMLQRLFSDDLAADDDLFGDLEKMFEESMSDAFRDMNSLQSISPGRNTAYQSQWQETASGRILEVTPKEKDQNLDINVEKEMITIKGKTEVKGAYGSALSSFSNSFSIPADVDASKVKIHQKEGKILIEFPFKTATVPPKKEERVPVGPQEGEVAI